MSIKIIISKDMSIDFMSIIRDRMGEEVSSRAFVPDIFLKNSNELIYCNIVYITCLTFNVL